MFLDYETTGTSSVPVDRTRHGDRDVCCSGRLIRANPGLKTSVPYTARDIGGSVVKYPFKRTATFDNKTVDHKFFFFFFSTLRALIRYEHIFDGIRRSFAAIDC